MSPCWHCPYFNKKGKRYFCPLKGIYLTESGVEFCSGPSYKYKKKHKNRKI